MKKRQWYPFTPEEDARILAQMDALKGRKLTSAVYATLAIAMDNRHSVPSLMSRASRLRNGRSDARPDHPSCCAAAPPEKTPPTPQKPPCKYPVAGPVAKEQHGLPLDAAISAATLRETAETLEGIAVQLLDKLELVKFCAEQQVKIDEYEKMFRVFQRVANKATAAATEG